MGFSERDLALHVSDDTFQKVLLSRRELEERRNEVRYVRYMRYIRYIR